MKILFDDAAFNQPFGGVTNYFVQLIRHLPNECRFELCQRTTQNFALQGPPFNIPKATNTQWNFLPWLNVRGKWMIYRILAKTVRMIPSCEYENRRLFVEKLKKGDFDVLHLTDPHFYTFEWERIVGTKPVVMTVHDLIPDMDPKKFRIRHHRAKALRLANHIIAVSENTKRDIVKIYGVDPRKITVIYHGAEQKDTVEGKCLFPTTGYLLYVGARWGYKNFNLFSRVASELMREREGLHLVCTGGALSEDAARPFFETGVMERVHAKYVEEPDLPSLYAHAAVFVYPSKYEGFGIPILDAFKAGCPVLLARSSCFPEVGGDAARYFDPENPEDLKTQIEKIVDDEELRKRMVLAGRERVKKFTWQRCAEETVAVYRSVLNTQIC